MEQVVQWEKKRLQVGFDHVNWAVVQQYIVVFQWNKEAQGTEKRRKSLHP